MVKYSESNRADEVLRADLLDELGIVDDCTSNATFTFQNLNYVKQKLFDPEIQYLQKKFQEKLKSITFDIEHGQK